jgi:hypothetical protein
MNAVTGQFCGSRTKILLPPETAAGIRSIFFSLFGGPARLDAWLTGIADVLADAGNPRTRPLPLPMADIPVAWQSWMHRPGEVVDMLLERLHDLSVWGYTVRIVRRGEGFQAMAWDQTSGHLVEAAEGSEIEGLIQFLAEKYGPNLEVVRE